MKEEIKNFGSKIIDVKYRDNIDYKIEFFTLIALLSSLCILHGISLKKLLIIVERIYRETEKKMLN